MINCLFAPYQTIEVWTHIGTVSYVMQYPSISITTCHSGAWDFKNVNSTSPNSILHSSYCIQRAIHIHHISHIDYVTD